MKHVVLPDNVQRKLSFYLAMEEYVAGVTDGRQGNVPLGAVD